MISLVPWRLIIAVAVILGGVIGVHIQAYRAGAASVQTRWDAERAQLTREHDEAVAAVNAESARRLAALETDRDQARKAAVRARGDAAAAAGAADGLRRQVAAVVAGARGCDSTAAGGGASATDTIGVLADLLGRIDERAGALAKAGDDARIAGEACERVHDALMPSTGQ